MHLMSHPTAYEKLMLELDNATRDGHLSEIPQYEEVQKHCPYYIACVREAMRLNPSAPNIFLRLARKGGIDLYGMHAPEGTEVTCNPWLVHRDEAIYGTDAGEFRPERWLESEEKTRGYLKYNITFGYGRESVWAVISL
jgi:cytochrome P450